MGKKTVVITHCEGPGLSWEDPLSASYPQAADNRCEFRGEMHCWGAGFLPGPTCQQVDKGK